MFQVSRVSKKKKKKKGWPIDAAAQRPESSRRHRHPRRNWPAMRWKWATLTPMWRIDASSSSSTTRDASRGGEKWRPEMNLSRIPHVAVFQTNWKNIIRTRRLSTPKYLSPSANCCEKPFKLAVWMKVSAGCSSRIGEIRWRCSNAGGKQLRPAVSSRQLAWSAPRPFWIERLSLVRQSRGTTASTR